MVNLGIVIPCINCLDLTRICVKSIRTKHPHTIIIVDNGSTDGTSEWAKSQGFQVVRFEEMKGIPVAMNAGFKRALELGCSHTILSHNDVILHKDAIDNLVNCYDKGNWILLSGVNQKGYYIPYGPLPLDYFSEPATIEQVDSVPIINSCQSAYALLGFFILSKKTIDEVGYFDEDFFRGAFADDDYRYRIRKAGHRATAAPCALFWHWGSQTFGRHDWSIVGDYLRNRPIYLKKWGGGPGGEKYRTPYNKKV